MNDFLIKSDILEKLDEKYSKAKELIIKAVENESMIIIRHHNDCDGFCAGLAIEHAIQHIIYGKLQTNKYYFHVKRLPSRAPYYEYTDMLRDLDTFDSKRKNKAHLLIVLDNGSTMQDAFPLKRIRYANINTIVIDHHFPNPIIDKIADVHINPFLVGGDENFVAGALSLELANLLYPNVNKELAHIACIADVSNMRDYQKFARFNEEEFYKKLTLVMDFEINQMRGMGLSVINKLATADKDLVYMMHNELSERIKIVEDISLKNCEIVEKNNFKYYSYNIKSISIREYPFNKAPGFLAWKLNSLKESFVLVAYSDDYIQFRSSYDKFSVLTVIEMLKKNMPNTIVDGGGHAMAGTVKVSPLKIKKAIELIEVYLKQIDVNE